METPVLFLIFNRPLLTEQVFFQIQKAKPKKLYVGADGPRPNNNGDIKLCEEARSIINRVDWDCEIFTLFQETNKGCKIAVSSAINWFFKNENSGIILEDDCLPDMTFFDFCTEMLARYENDYRIAHIGGSNFQNGIKRSDGDYYYSNLTHVWGWASWRRVWAQYDVDMKLWEKFDSEGHLKFIFNNKRIEKHLKNMFDKTKNGLINTWDFQLFFSNIINRGLSIVPNVNLISNIGFAADATHSVKNDANANRIVNRLSGFKAPEFIIPSFEADIYTLNNSIGNRYDNLRKKITSAIKG